MTKNKKRVFVSALVTLCCQMNLIGYSEWRINQLKGVSFSLTSRTEPVCYIQGSRNIYYTNLATALSDAKTNKDTVVLIPGQKDVVTVSDVTIPSGVTLFLPVSSSPTTNGEYQKVSGNAQNFRNGFFSLIDNVNQATDYGDSVLENRETTLRVLRKLKIEKGANRTVDGVLGSAYQGISGHTSGKYSEVQVCKGAVVENEGTLDLRGYRKEVKQSAAKWVYTDGNETEFGVLKNQVGGTVYTPLVIDDFGGGSHTVGSFLAGGVCPFSGLDFPNIQIKYRNDSSSSLYGWADLYTDAMKNVAVDVPATHNRCSPKIIGSSDALINLKTGSILTSKFTSSKATEGLTTNDWSSGPTFNSDGTRKTGNHRVIEINGGAISGNLALDVSVGGGKVPISTESVLIPVSWRYDLILENGTYDFNSSRKYRSGSSLTIKNGATLNRNKDLVFYPSGFDDNKINYPYCKGLPEAKFLIDGSSALGNGSLGGFIQSSKSGTSTLNLSNRKNLKVGTKEGNGTFEKDKKKIIDLLADGKLYNYASAAIKAAEILSFLNGKKEYKDIEQSVKKLSGFNPTYEATITAQGLVGSDTNRTGFTNSKYVSNGKNVFWTKQ